MTFGGSCPQNKGKKMAYSTSERLEILNYAKEHTVNDAAIRYRVSKPAIVAWGKKYNIPLRYKKRWRTRDEKLAILKQVNILGTAEVVKRFNVTVRTLSTWNDELGLMPSLRAIKVQKKRHFTPTEKREILTYAQEHSIGAATYKYGVNYAVIYKWNKIYQIFKPRPIRHFTDEQKSEILKCAHDTTVSRAAYKFNVAPLSIRQWQEKLSKKQR